MKKIIALTLALMMALSLAACGEKTQDNETNPPARLTDDELVEKITALCDGKTGEMNVENTSFEKLAANGFETAGLWANWFNGMAFPDGALVAVNQPTMMGQPHMALLIQPAEGADAGALAKELEKNANPNWNVCTTADFVKCEVKDGLILFVMSKPADDDGNPMVDAQGIVDAFVKA